MIPQAHKTIVKPHDKNPVWGQAFQCVSIHPSTDMLAVEVTTNEHPDNLIGSNVTVIKYSEKK